jgi:hypothetical protein
MRDLLLLAMEGNEKQDERKKKEEQLKIRMWPSGCARDNHRWSFRGTHPSQHATPHLSPFSNPITLQTTIGVFATD